MLKISIENGAFKDSFGREVVLRGINFAADAKLPAKPFIPSHAPEDDLFFDGDNVSFVGSPCSLEELDLHLKRLKSWGFNTIRYIFTWEALEHDGPGIYDEEFIDFTIKVLYRLKHYQFYVIMDPHQDCWSRFCGGSGAPLWTHYAAGLNPRNFKTTQAALLESHFLDKPKEKPKMVWASNYTRLAASTLFTLFFAGKIFAPKCVINGLNIQDFLESHFINAVTRLAERVHSDTTEPGGLEKCIIGWESINEPGHGYIGIEDLTEVPKSQQVKLYTVPTGANGMALGYGYEQTMPKFEFGLMGPKVVNSKVSVDPKGVKAWLSPEETEHFDKHYGWKRAESWVAGECIWHLHGVWKDSKRGFTLLRPDYFCYDLEGKHMDHSRFVDETFTNHWLAYVKSLKKVIPDDSFLFYQPPVLASPPDLKSRGLVEKNMVYSPHYYDGLTLMLKHWNKNFNVDAVGVIRGKYANPPVMAVRLGENNIRRCLGDQLATLKKEGIDAFGADVPCLITEIGVPYDMDDKQAYNTGDFSSQIRSMDANNHALEFARLSHTLWVYVTRNTNKFGDNWNGEDLSIWSADAVRSNESNGTAVLVQKIKTRSSSLGLSKSKTPESIHSAENIDDLTLAPISENCASANQADYSNFHHPKNFLEGSSTPSSLRKSTDEDPDVEKPEFKPKHRFKFWRKSRGSIPKNATHKSTVFENPDVGVEEKHLVVHVASGTDPQGQYEVRVPKAVLQAYLKLEEFAVYDFTGMEHADPEQWSKRKKIVHTVLYGMTTLVSQFNSAILSPAVSQIMNEFNVSFKIAVLCTCIYILGIALGPLLFAPMSEQYGRKLSTLLPFVIGALFTFMAACSTRIWFVILFRGLAGVCSAAPMVISGGMLSDIWSPKVRGNYLIIYSNFVTLGPCVAPIVAPVLLRYMSWRGLLFITSGLYLVVATVNVMSLSESYAPVILAREASARRMRTGNFLHHAKLDETSMTPKEFLKRHVRRPFKMMAVPLIALVALYASFVFGLFYLVTTSVPTTFQDYRDFSQIYSGLPMLAVYTGATVLGVPINLLVGLRYARKLTQNHNEPMPEQRLFAVLFLGLVLPIGIALFGYTVSNSQFHWIVPCLGLTLIGAGFFVIFQGCLNFLVDALPKYSASAMAVSTCMRSMLAGFFPLFSREIFYTFGIEQGTGVLTIIAVLCVPIPFCFFYFSNAINKKYQQYNFDL